MVDPSNTVIRLDAGYEVTRTPKYEVLPRVPKNLFASIEAESALYTENYP